MQLGAKCGLQNWQEVTQKTQAPCYEIWFRIDWAKRYDELFTQLHRQKAQFGLHFWGVLAGQYDPNLAYSEENIADETQELMARNIQIAADVGAHYVNIHPGALKLRRIDLEQGYLQVFDDKKIDIETARASLLKRTKELDTLAREKGVLLLVETLPKNELEGSSHPDRRHRTQDAQGIGPELLIELAAAGRYITNDIGHTTASWEVADTPEDREVLFEKVMSVSRALAPQTKLLHVNTVCPPFNGTDSHNGVLEEDFRQNVFPSKHQLEEWLRLYKDRDDVWAIVEPEIEVMAENYFELRKLGENI